MNTTISVETGSRSGATLWLKRADRGNAFNQAMLNEVHSALIALASNPSVRTLVLRGDGKHFCTGADISARGDSDSGVSLNDVLNLLDDFPKPVIGVVHGGCVGGGLAIAACCDVILADSRAFFAVPELRVGLAPSVALTGYFLRIMGPRAFRRYGLSGERIGSADALRLGIAHEVVEAADIDARLKELVDDFLHSAPLALAELKGRIAQLSASAPALYAHDGARGLERSPEAREGVAAFKEKRKPVWYSSLN
jgi:methylglutaconyl-CoA hydratase